MKHSSISTLFSPGDTSLSRIDDDPFTLPIKAVVLLDLAARLSARAKLERQKALAEEFYKPRTISAGIDALTLETGVIELMGTLRAKSAAELSTDSGTGAAVSIQRVSPAQSFAAIKIAPVYTLTTLYGALMELHSIDAQNDPRAYGRMVAAAERISEVAQEAEGVEVAKFGSAVGVSCASSASPAY